MLELANLTGWNAMLVAGWHIERKRQMTLVVKTAYTFELDGTLEPITPDIEVADRHYGEPQESGLAVADEAVPFKRGGEVLLTGTAHPPEGASAVKTELAIGFSSGEQWSKVLRVVGKRYWERRFFGAIFSLPEPLEPLPLRYEYAYGGVDERRGTVYDYNPIGLGYASHGRIANGQPLPQIEQPPHFITRPRHRSKPAGYGPLPRQWLPRLAECRGYDEEALASGLCPFLKPVPRTLFNAAPPDQRFPKPFTGGERLTLSGFFAETRAPVELQLPPVAPVAHTVFNGRWEALPLVCDTLRIDTDAREVHQIWRAGVIHAMTDSRHGWVVLRDAAADTNGEERGAREAPAIGAKQRESVS